MQKYYTRVCNFYYGSESIKKILNKSSLPLNGSKLISFDTLEIITRKNIRRINIKKINSKRTSVKKKKLEKI